MPYGVELGDNLIIEPNPIGRLFGISIEIDWSWLFIFLLVTWNLAAGVFPSLHPDWSPSLNWGLGVAASLLFFASVLAHELSHALVAQARGLPVRRITLFIFGGVAQMRGEPPTPKAEFRIAVAGPLSSFLLALVFSSFYAVSASPDVRALYSYLAQLNLILGIFNLIPGFPMDGGRVLRAYLWEKKKDFIYATRKAASFGQHIALFFLFFGLFSIFAGFSGGLWLMLIGWFLYTAAQASYQQADLQSALGGVKVRDVMVAREKVVTIWRHAKPDDE